MGDETDSSEDSSNNSDPNPFTGISGYNADAFGGVPKPTIASETPGSDAYIPGINTTAFDPQYGTTQGAPYSYDNTGVVPGVGGSSASSNNIVKRITDLFKDKESTGRSILDAILAMYAIKSTLDQRKIQNQARGHQGGINMNRVAVQPTNIPAARAYGAGAVGQPYKATTYAAEGGIMGLARGGAAKPPRYLDGSTDGMADKINTDIDGKQAAKLSHGEFVIPADVVSHLGNGNSKAGADVLYKMMDRVRKARTGTKKQGKRINPAKFMPGGIAGYAGGGAVAFNVGGAATTPTAGTSVTSNLSEWAGPYVTDMLSQANALGNQPYQAYTGPLTAGTSPLQQQAFTGYQNFQTPGAIGQAAQTAGGIAGQMQGMQYSPTQFGNQFQGPGAYQGVDFSAGLTPQAYQAGQFANQFQGPGAYQAGQFNTGLGPVGSVQSYMNPYLQGVTDIEAREARRQADIDRNQAAARLAKAGAYGGSRQAIMEAEGLRNLQTRIGDITSRGLNTAYDKALAQRLSESQASMEAQKAVEASRQFGAQQGMTGAELAAKYGLSGQELGEKSRQFGATQEMQGLQLLLDARKAQEASRQFGAQQAMTAAQTAAQYGLAGQQEAEKSKQFGANYGLESLKNALSAAQAQGNLGVQQGEMGLKGLAAQLGAGAQQSDIEQKALDAQRAQFEEARAYPYKQLQFKQSMLSGLPISTQNAVAQTTGMQDLSALIDAIRGIGSAT